MVFSTKSQYSCIDTFLKPVFMSAKSTKFISQNNIKNLSEATAIKKRER